MTTTAAQNAAICNRAAEMIRERGWFRMASATHKDLYEKKTANPACLLYAMVGAKREFIGGAHFDVQSILGLDIETSVWNDTHTKRDVLNLLTERAAFWQTPEVTL